MVVIKNDRGVYTVPKEFISGTSNYPYNIPRTMEKFASDNKTFEDAKFTYIDDMFNTYTCRFGDKSQLCFEVSFIEKYVGVRILTQRLGKDPYKLTASDIESSFMHCEFIFDSNNDATKIDCTIVSKEKTGNSSDVTAYTVTLSDAGLSLMYFDSARTKKARSDRKSLFSLSGKLLDHAINKYEWSEILPDKEEQAILDVSEMTLSEILDMIMEYYRDPDMIGTDIQNYNAYRKVKEQDQ